MQQSRWHDRIRLILGSSRTTVAEKMLASNPDCFAPWIDLISFRPPEAVQKEFLARGPRETFYFHSLEDPGNGETINLDHYETVISKMPYIDGHVCSPEDLLYLVRTKLPEVIDLDLRPIVSMLHLVPRTPGLPTLKLHFEPDTVEDKSRWMSRDRVLGSLCTFDFGEKAAVLATEVTPLSWTFSTVATEYARKHPVSGQRQFGIREDGGNYIFFTRVADRATSTLDVTLEALGARTAQSIVWRALVSGVCRLVNENNGTAKLGGTKDYRPYWDGKFIDRYFKPHIDGPVWVN